MISKPGLPTDAHEAMEKQGLLQQPLHVQRRMEQQQLVDFADHNLWAALENEADQAETQRGASRARVGRATP